MKVVTIVGARPQFIKAANLSRLLKQDSSVVEKIVHTGQHFDENMSAQFFSEMSIPAPNYQLNLGGGRHGEMTGQMMMAIEPILIDEKPDWVLVYGDTNSTLAGALTAGKLNIPVAHVESGLRSFNRKMPEEVNRILTDHISSILFCPSQLSADQLLKEGIEGEKIHVVGDIMYDSVLFYRDSLQPSEVIVKLAQKKGEFVLCTIHRAENTDDEDRLKNIFLALDKISEQVEVILPLHPRTKAKIDEYRIDTSNINLLEPVGYRDMLHLLEASVCLITDSGGMQKEACFLSRPCVTLRDETEWSETVSSGVNTLVGASREAIGAAVHKYQNEKCEFPEGLYGDGSAAQLILKCLKEDSSTL